MVSPPRFFAPPSRLFDAVCKGYDVIRLFHVAHVVRGNRTGPNSISIVELSHPRGPKNFLRTRTIEACSPQLATNTPEKTRITNSHLYTSQRCPTSRKHRDTPLATVSANSRAPPSRWSRELRALEKLRSWRGVVDSASRWRGLRFAGFRALGGRGRR